MSNETCIKICITVGAIILTVLHQFSLFTLDSISAILLVIAVLPWLRPLVKSVELLGVKVELQDLKDKIADAKGAAESAKQQAIFAQSATVVSVTRNSTSLEHLANQYDEVRATQPPGDNRTRAMTAIVHEIIAHVPNAQDFDFKTALMAKEPGKRLVAYALLYARPDILYLENLVKSVTQIEDKPFGQYWGLQAIKRIIDITSTARQLPPELIGQIRDFSIRVPRGTDRDYELRKILERIEGGSFPA